MGILFINYSEYVEEKFSVSQESIATLKKFVSAMPRTTTVPLLEAKMHKLIFLINEYCSVGCV
jgi:hypothetical protein